MGWGNEEELLAETTVEAAAVEPESESTDLTTETTVAEIITESTEPATIQTEPVTGSPTTPSEPETSWISSTPYIPTTPEILTSTEVSSTPEVFTTTEVSTSTEDTNVSLEDDMGLLETVFMFITVFIPNISRISAGIFGAWIQLGAGIVEKNVLKPLFSVLGNVFNFPLENGVFDLGTMLADVGAFVTDMASLVAMPVINLADLIFGSIHTGLVFLEPIGSCLLSGVNAAKEMLIAIFEVVPACLVDASMEVLTIIVDTYTAIENMSTLFAKSLTVLNDAAVNPFYAVFRVS